MDKSDFEFYPNYIIFSCDGKPFAYHLMKDSEEVTKTLADYGCRPIVQNDWKFDATLPQKVRDEMAARSLPYAITSNVDDGMIHHYIPGKGSLCVPLKFLRPLGELIVTITINEKRFRYFMTNDFSEIKKKLWDLHCLAPQEKDWTEHFELSQKVMNKMTELGATYSLTLSHNTKILNYYREDRTPLFINIRELYKKQQAEIHGGAIAQAIRKDDTDSVKILLKPKSDSEKLVLHTWTPLMVAAAYNAKKVATLLVENGANVNAVNSEGISALMIAASKGSKEVTEILLAHGADTQIRAENGWTAFVHALANNHADIAKLLNEEEKPANSDSSLVTQLQNKHLPFHDKLGLFIARFIALGEHKSCEIYQNLHGCISRQTFSKLQSTVVHPSKRNVLLLSIGLNLSLEETEDFLMSAGFAFSETDEEEQIIREFIRNKNYDIFDIDNAVWEKTGKSLRTKKSAKKEKF